MAHTPGPWEIAFKSGFPTVFAGKVEIASPHFSRGLGELQSSEEYRQEILANAYLIAAAPELLEALKEMLDLYIWDSDASDRAKAAIAKAEGR